MGRPKTDRTERLHILMSPDENAILRELAARQGLTPSDIVRQLIRREHAKMVAASPKKGRK